MMGMKRWVLVLGLILAMTPSVGRADTVTDVQHYRNDRECARIHNRHFYQQKRIMARLACIEVNGVWVSGLAYAA